MTSASDRHPRHHAFLSAGLLALACLATGGCLSSARHDFLAIRADAPRPAAPPQRGVTLAEAEMSNVGPARPPAALAGVGRGADR